VCIAVFLWYAIPGKRAASVFIVVYSLLLVVLHLLGEDKLDKVVRSKSWFGCMDCGMIKSGQPDVIGPGVNYV
jgi:hypothetical protein